MSTIRSGMKRPAVFRLPSLSSRKSTKHPTLAAHLVTTSSSDERVKDATPTLKALEELLKRPIP